MEEPLETLYPFLTTPTDELRPILDFYAFLRIDLQLPLRLIRYTSLTGSADIRLADQSGTVVDTVSWTYTSRTAGSIITHEWTDGNSVCRMIVATALDVVIPGTYTTDIRLDPRTYDERPDGVSSIVVGSDETSGTVELLPGNNAEWQYTSPRTLTLDLSAGSGLGVNPGCEEDILLRTISGQGPNDFGNFALKSFECYRIDNDGPATITIGNDCGPCFTYGQIQNAYRSLIKLKSLYQGLVDRIDTMEDIYTSGIDRWNNQKDCRESNPIRVAVLQGGDRCLSVGVAGANTSTVCINDVGLHVYIEAVIFGKLDRDTTLWYPVNGDPVEIRSPGGAWPNYCSHWDQIPPQRTAKATYQLRFPMNMRGTTVRVRAIMTVEDRPIVGAVWEHEITW